MIQWRRLPWSRYCRRGQNYFSIPGIRSHSSASSAWISFIRSPILWSGASRSGWSTAWSGQSSTSWASCRNRSCRLDVLISASTSDHPTTSLHCKSQVNLLLSPCPFLSPCLFIFSLSLSLFFSFSFLFYSRLPSRRRRCCAMYYFESSICIFQTQDSILFSIFKIFRETILTKWTYCQAVTIQL